MRQNLNDPFEVCFSMLKMRYKDYDESLTQKDFLVPTDKINVFINLESLFKNISMVMDLERKIVKKKVLIVLLILLANYLTL